MLNIYKIMHGILLKLATNITETKLFIEHQLVHVYAAWHIITH